MDTSEKEFYENLKIKLEETTEWPSDYVFKFILPSHQRSIDRLIAIFDDKNATISTRASSKGKFTSITIRIRLKSPDFVIEKYKEVGQEIEGVISL